jgi:hypothetical protein
LIEYLEFPPFANRIEEILTLLSEGLYTRMASVMEPMVEKTVSKIRVSDEKLSCIEGLVSMVSSFRQEVIIMAVRISRKVMVESVRLIMYFAFLGGKDSLKN